MRQDEVLLQQEEVELRGVRVHLEPLAALPGKLVELHQDLSRENVWEISACRVVNKFELGREPQVQDMCKKIIFATTT